MQRQERNDLREAFMALEKDDLVERLILEGQAVEDREERLADAYRSYGNVCEQLLDTARSIKRQRDENRSLIAQLKEQRENDPVKLQKELERVRSALQRAIYRSEQAEDPRMLWLVQTKRWIPGCSWIVRADTLDRALELAMVEGRKLVSRHTAVGADDFHSYLLAVDGGEGILHEIESE